MSVINIEKAKVVEIYYINQENGYHIVGVETEDDFFTAVGYMSTIEIGRMYNLSGKWTTHQKYGEQFEVEMINEVLPEKIDEIEDFLASGIIKGIGKKTAHLMVNAFGTETLNIMENQPERLMEIDGIGEKKMEVIKEAYIEKRQLTSLSFFLQKFGIGNSYALKLYKTYGEDAEQLIAENPYRLIDDIWGISFKKADEIALKMGISEDNIDRIKASIKYVLQFYSNEGSTYIPFEILSEKVISLVDTNREMIEETVREMVFDDELHMEEKEKQKRVFLMSHFLAEQKVCHKLMKLNKNNEKTALVDIEGIVDLVEGQKGITLSKGQKEAVIKSLKSGVSVITGGPGTGKTTIINVIIEALESCDLKIAITAPTGRGAKRITETSGHSASTIHRLLEYYYDESQDTMRFGRNEENPLEEDLLIIDEASMIDIFLMKGIMEASHEEMAIIFVGDSDQLPSVGAGNVLKDLIDSEVITTSRLTEIYRQAKESYITINAHRINKGEYLEFQGKDRDFFFINTNNQQEIVETIKGLCEKRLPNYVKSEESIKDIQVLTPVRKNILGMYNLNKELQKVLNPANEKLEELQIGDRLFRQGDKVMQIKNNYNITWVNTEDFTEGEGIFNGDIGFIQSIDKDSGVVNILFDDNKLVEYEMSNLKELEQAYAMTVHKSQGSEFPVVVMPISSFPPMLATRNLLYTAVTRGKKLVVLVGAIRSLNGMIDNDRIKARYTSLDERLKGASFETFE